MVVGSRVNLSSHLERFTACQGLGFGMIWKGYSGLSGPLHCYCLLFFHLDTNDTAGVIWEVSSSVTTRLWGPHGAILISARRTAQQGTSNQVDVA